MFEGLDWSAALKRAALMTGFYWLIVYAMSVAFPKSFGISSQELPGLLTTTAMVFLLFTVFTAFTERARKRRGTKQNESKNSSKNSKPAGDGDGEESPSALKGRPNPNASRKKTRRKR
ncbi:MAG: hypothetical protein H0W54_07710 [Rubrobacter sp.]|nr:hypothetical protein [Rubrobacter sp.]